MFIMVSLLLFLFFIFLLSLAERQHKCCAIYLFISIFEDSLFFHFCDSVDVTSYCIRVSLWWWNELAFSQANITTCTIDGKSYMQVLAPYIFLSNYEVDFCNFTKKKKIMLIWFVTSLLGFSLVIMLFVCDFFSCRMVCIYRSTSRA